MNLEFWKKLREEYSEDDLFGTDAARIKRAKQTPGQEPMTKDKITKEDCGCMNEEKTPKLNKVTRTPGTKEVQGSCERSQNGQYQDCSFW